MRSLDETDHAILRLLLEDARRPYSEIAERVGVSPPTVSDRVDRLEQMGVIEQFTLDVDRSILNDGVPVVVEVNMIPGVDDRVVERLAATPQVERVYQTADARFFVEATVEEDEVRPMLAEAVDLSMIDDFQVHLLSDRRWEPQLAVPGVRVGSEGREREITPPSDD